MLLAAVLLASGTAFAQPSAPLAPIVDDPTAALASPNVHLVAHLPDVGATGGRFAGKYFFMTATGGSILTAGPVGGLRIYDASNPELPVLAGVLPLPHYENEDVDVSLKRGVALISMDDQTNSVPLGGALFVVDVSDVTKPMLRSVVQYPADVGSVKSDDPRYPDGRKPLGGPGHIANCILDCNFAYVTGARNGKIFVIDLRDLDTAKIIGSFATPAGAANDLFTTGTVHDVNVDWYGNVWATGSGGTAMYAPVTPRTILKPKLISYVSANDNKRYDQFIHHNSLRLDRSHVLVTEEDWQQPMCGKDGLPAAEPPGETETPPGLAPLGEQGSFQVWKINRSRLSPVGTWRSEIGRYLDGGAAVTIVCSSHWFSFNRNKVVAVGWYNQGVRFLDVSNPRAIRQVGYWMGPYATASAGLFAPGRPDIAYVPDYTRGLDVLKIDGGGLHARTQVAPVRAEWFAGYAGVQFAPTVRRDPVWGWACVRPVVSAESAA
jgi:hypothetical protein